MKITEAHAKAAAALSGLTTAALYDQTGDTAAPAPPAVLLGVPSTIQQVGQCAWTWDVEAQCIAGALTDRAGLLAIAEEVMDAYTAAGIACQARPDTAAVDGNPIPAVLITASL